MIKKPMFEKEVVMRFKCFILLSAFVLSLGLSSTSTAALLNNPIQFPRLVFDQQSTLIYDSVTNVFTIEGVPVAIELSPGAMLVLIEPAPVVGEAVKIQIVVDENGNLVSGVPGYDLIIDGQVDIDNNGSVDYSGRLLQGQIFMSSEVSGFGFQDTGGTTDNYDFRFIPTGGELAFLWEGVQIGIIVASEQSDFETDPPTAGGLGFNVDISGEAKGTLGSIPIPTGVPTMTQWGMIVFILLIAGLAVWTIRSRVGLREAS
jgi:hypothetical protein